MYLSLTHICSALGLALLSIYKEIIGTWDVISTRILTLFLIATKGNKYFFSIEG